MLKHKTILIRELLKLSFTIPNLKFNWKDKSLDIICLTVGFVQWPKSIALGSKINSVRFFDKAEAV